MRGLKSSASCQRPSTTSATADDRVSSLHFNGFTTRVSRPLQEHLSCHYCLLSVLCVCRHILSPPAYCHISRTIPSLTPHFIMSTKDAERELEIEGLVDLPALRKLRRSRKGQLTKLEKDLERYRDQSLGELKRPALESMLTNFDKQHLFYTLIQD